MSLDRLKHKRAAMRLRFQAMLAAEGVLDLKVSDAMTHSVECVRPQATVLDMVKLLHSNGFRHLLVTDAAGELVGVVSDRDLVRCFGPAEYPDQTALARIIAADVMSRELVTISPDHPLSAAIDQILDHGVNCLPVVVQRRLVGILTTTDLYAVLQEVLESLRRAQPEPTAAAARCGQ